MKKIKIKYHSYDIDRLEKIKVGDWIDLRAAEDAFIPQGGYELISLGVSMKLPDGYEAHVLPRSSTFKNFGIIMTNSMGIIDNSYSGTNDIWRFPAYCLRGNEWVTMENGEYFYGVRIHKGDRIAQFRIMKTQPKVEFDEVMFLDEVDRGGIGSTGVN